VWLVPSLEAEQRLLVGKAELEKLVEQLPASRLRLFPSALS
jgi:hypothetical protein